MIIDATDNALVQTDGAIFARVTSLNREVININIQPVAFTLPAGATKQYNTVRSCFSAQTYVVTITSAAWAVSLYATDDR